MTTFLEITPAIAALAVPLFCACLIVRRHANPGSRSARDGIQRLHGRWFRLSSDQFDTLHYAGMSIFKIGIILFNLGALCRPVDRRLTDWNFAV